MLDKTGGVQDVPKEMWGRKRGAQRQDTPQLGFIGEEKPCYGGFQQEENIITKGCKDLKIFGKMFIKELRWSK